MTDPKQPEQSKHSEFIISNKVEHSCCWNTAIRTKVEAGKGAYGSDMLLVCECDEDYAALIAAAPDLLAACIVALEHMEDCYENTVSSLSEEIAIVKSAISKATNHEQPETK